MSDLPGLLLATLLTLAMFSRVWRPNLGFRLAERLLLGALAGYAAAVVTRGVLLPGVLAPLLEGDSLALIPLALILLLALRFTARPGLRAWGLLPLGVLVGGGAALAVAGALRGTLAPQLLAPLQLRYLPAGPVWAELLAVVLSAGVTLTVLLYLWQGASRERKDERLGPLAWVGYAALMVACGALLATTAGARLTLLIDRVQYFLMLWGQALAG